MHAAKINQFLVNRLGLDAGSVVMLEITVVRVVTNVCFVGKAIVASSSIVYFYSICLYFTDKMNEFNYSFE